MMAINRFNMLQSLSRQTESLNVARHTGTHGCAVSHLSDPRSMLGDLCAGSPQEPNGYRTKAQQQFQLL
jgi:hypothetical protein